MIRQGIDDPSTLSALHQQLASPSTSDPVHSPFAFFMPPFNSSSSSDGRGSSGSHSAHNMSLLNDELGSSTAGSDASQSQTPRSQPAPGSGHLQRSPASTADRHLASPNPGSWAGFSSITQPFSPSMAFHSNPVSLGSGQPQQHGSQSSAMSANQSYLAGIPVAQRNKQLLLQTSGLPNRRPSFGPTSGASNNPPSLPSTPQSAANSLPGSPMTAAPNEKQKSRPSVSNSMNIANIRKKRGTGSSSSLSTSIPVSHPFAMPLLPVFTPPTSPQSPDATAPPQQPIPILSFASSGLGGNRTSIVSNSSTDSQLQDNRASQDPMNMYLSDSLTSSNGGFVGSPATSPVTQVSAHMAAMWNLDSNGFSTPFSDALHQQGHAAGASSPTHAHAGIADLSVHYPSAHGQGHSGRQLQIEQSNVASDPVSHPLPSTKLHALPPSLHMSSFPGSSVPVSAHATDSAMMMMNLVNQYRRNNAAASPGGMSEMLTDDAFGGMSPDLGAGVVSPSLGHTRHLSSHSMVGPTPTGSSGSGGSISGSLSGTSSHFHRMEALTRKMMAIGLNREQAEAAAERATASVGERGAAIVVDEKMDVGQCKALGEMVASGKVSMKDAIARVTAATIGSSVPGSVQSQIADGFGSTPAAGTPLGTVKEEQESDFFSRPFSTGDDDTRGRTQEKGKSKPTKIVGFGGTGDDDQEDFTFQLMDWRAISRSRSRAEGMEWRESSQTRSGPPAPSGPLPTSMPWMYASEAHSHSLLQEESKHHRSASFSGFGTDVGRLPGVSSNQKFTSAIPIPGSMFKSPAYRGKPVGMQRSAEDGGLPPTESSTTSPSVAPGQYDFGRKHASESGPLRDVSGLDGRQPSPHLNVPQHDSLHPHLSFSSSFGTCFHPSSLPAAGLQGVGGSNSIEQTLSPPGPWGQEKKHLFPRHVRKTSFDHTVSRSGLLGDISGRHQVNGRPLGPDSTLGKRRADITPHIDSFSRGDGSASSWLENTWSQDSSSTGGSTPFPQFTFSVPGSFSLFGNDAVGRDKGSSSSGQDTIAFPRAGLPFDSAPYVSSSAADFGNGGEQGDSAHGFSHLSNSFDGGANFEQIMGMGMYGSGAIYDPSSIGADSHMQSFNTVDPTQILGTPELAGGDAAGTYQPSPQSQGWASGSTPSSTASPEPTFASSAPTGSVINRMHPPTSTATATATSSATNRAVRRISGPKRLSQDMSVRLKEEQIHISSTSSNVIALPNSTKNGSQGSGSSGTPGSGTGEETGEPSVTQCTNCETKNTPLWRRDPEGNPLCNACGLFYKLHGVTRPMALKTDIIKKRNRASNNLVSRKSTGSSGAGTAASAVKATSSSATGPKRSSISHVTGRPSMSAVAQPSSMGSMKRQRRASVGNPSLR